MSSFESKLFTCTLVFGVSGVGKTRACEEYVKRNPHYLLTRASCLLASVTRQTPEALRVADAEQINQNQRLLISAFNEFKKNQFNRPIIMEAHATIYNDFELVDVPINIIEELAPTHLVLLEASEQDILKRRRSDVRKRPIRSISEIRDELARERHAVTAYAAILQIPLTIANATETFTLDDIIS